MDIFHRVLLLKECPSVSLASDLDVFKMALYVGYT